MVERAISTDPYFHLANQVGTWNRDQEHNTNKKSSLGKIKRNQISRNLEEAGSRCCGFSFLPPVAMSRSQGSILWRFDPARSVAAARKKVEEKQGGRAGEKIR
jgi:hypothetical protein